MNVAVDVSGVVLTTPRLLLRPWREDDLEDFFTYASVDGVGQMAGWLPHQNRVESLVILRKFIEGKKTFALVREGKVIGSLGIERYSEERFPELAALRCRELGFVLAREYWGQGLMPEAVERALRWCFEELGLDVVLCAHFLTNTRSARVQEKCGFRHYSFGTFQTRFGTVEDDETNILCREEWEKRQETE